VYETLPYLGEQINMNKVISMVLYDHNSHYFCKMIISLFSDYYQSSVTS